MESCRNCKHFGLPICSDCGGARHYQPIGSFSLPQRLKEILTNERHREETYVTFKGRTYKAQEVAISTAIGDECSTLELKVDLSPTNYVGVTKSTPQIKDVIFNPPATIVFWDDDTKTVVRAQGDDIYDPEKGIAMAISKKILGNKYDYYNTFAKYLKKWDRKQGIE